MKLWLKYVTSDGRGWGSNLKCSCEILWMEEILHQLIDGLFNYL